MKTFSINTWLKQLTVKLLLLLSTTFTTATAQIHLLDDTGEFINLKQPARKIISLSPGLTELIYAAGGSEYLKGVVSFSNFPEPAKKIPQVGSFNALDIERILLMKPDLIIAWQSGNPRSQIEQLKKFGLTVYLSEPREFSDISDTIIKLGKLMGTETVAEQNARHFLQQFSTLKMRYHSVDKTVKKRTFIQIWNDPVMSVNQEHLISRVISFCGGENIFAQAKSLTYAPNIESVLELDPEIIIATGMTEASEQWLKRWRQWPFLSAVKNNRLYAVNPDHLVRHTPRILLGIKEVCQIINAEP